MVMRALTLILPGPHDTGYLKEQCPALACLLARADPCAAPDTPHDSYEAMLCALFGIHAAPDRDVPIAALTHLVDFDADHDGAWMRADPVVLRADLGSLRLLDTVHLRLGLDEASALAAEVRSVLAEQGFALHIGRHTRRWYLRLPEVPAITTRPPSAALGAHVDAFLPIGPERRFWHRLANDVQMVLHGAAINAAREERGEPPINSLWFWGAGTLPDRISVHCWDSVIADDPLVVGLARHSGVSQAPLPGSAWEIAGREQAERQVLTVLSREHPAGAVDRLEHGDERWFGPLLSMLQHRQLARLTLYVETRCFTITWLRAWRVWRRAGRQHAGRNRAG